MAAAVGGGGITTAMMLKGSATVKGKKGTYTADCYPRLCSLSNCHIAVAWHALKSVVLAFPTTETDAQFIARVTHMNLNAKKLTAVDHLDACTNLRVLYLYENSISTMRGFDALTNLTDLYLAHNRITRIEGLGCLRGLKKLYLDNNFIQRVEGLVACTQLEELTLNNQRFLATSASGQHDGGGATALSFDADSLAAVASTLRTLQLSNSRAVDIAPLAVLSSLQVLHLANNPISNFDDVAAVLAATDQLRELRLSDTPVAGVHKYRDRIVIATRADIALLDGKKVSDRERVFLRTLAARKQQRQGQGQGQPLSASELFAESAGADAAGSPP